MSRPEAVWMRLDFNVDLIADTAELEATIDLDCIESKVSEAFQLK